MLKYLEEKSMGIGVLLSFIPIVWGITTYIYEAKENKRANTFLSYQKIIQDMLNTSEGGAGESASSQRALIYELGNFSSYSEFTCREISRLKIRVFRDKDTLLELDLLSKRLQCAA